MAEYTMQEKAGLLAKILAELQNRPPPGNPAEHLLRCRMIEEMIDDCHSAAMGW